MDPRRKDSLLWGIVGGLAFLVLVQGYELVAGESIALTVKAGVRAPGVSGWFKRCVRGCGGAFWAPVLRTASVSNW